MNVKNIKKGCAIAFVMYVALSIAFFWVAGDQLRFQESATDAINPKAPTGEIVQNVEYCQPFIAGSDEITGISLRLSTYERANTSHTVISIAQKDGLVLARSEVRSLEVEDNMIKDIIFSEPVKLRKGEQYQIILNSYDGITGNAITAWYGNTVSTARAEVPLQLKESEKLRKNGEIMDGQLHYVLHTRNYLGIYKIYWHLVFGIGIIVSLYMMYLLIEIKRGKSTVVLRLISAFQRYGYLMRQLVARDFKTKYKRSILGVFWSFLNPLLTMFVQYIVFSTLFKTDILNFPLYLLIGIVCFNFFNEAAYMSLQSIVGNASLITKVYVPKYIYPVSRVFSSTINLLLSMLPLFVVMIFTKTPIRKALLLLPFGLLCLVVFCIGIGFILSTLMVFFRDTQFLWGVISMLWMYLTPIFYPENIIPTQYLPLYKCNPLYQIITFIRIILIEGVSPEPKTYLYCMLMSIVSLLIGSIVFKKNQDKFVMNL